MTPATSRQRRHARTDDRIEARDSDYQERVRRGFLRFCADGGYLALYREPYDLKSCTLGGAEIHVLLIEDNPADARLLIRHEGPLHIFKPAEQAAVVVVELQHEELVTRSR